MRLDRAAGESGSVMLWAVGALAVGTMTAMAAAGVAGLVGTERNLSDAADVAALAAANEVEVSGFLQSGSYSDLGVDLPAARTAAVSALRDGDFSARLASVRLTSKGVLVEVEVQWRPPLGMPTQWLTAVREVVLVLGG